jgi:hypothetical protein
MYRKIISANKAAEIMGCPARLVRERLRRGVWKFGRAIQPTENSKQWTYEVYTDQLRRYLEGR